MPRYHSTKTTALVLAVSVCLLLGTGARRYVNKAARESRPGYPAHIAPEHLRPDSSGVVTFYAIGDQGASGKRLNAVAGLLRADVRSVGAREVRPFVLGTGDNYYPDGLPEGWPKDHKTELKLNRRFGDIFSGVTHGEVTLTWHVVLGNHDYRGDALLWETFAEGQYEGTYPSLRLVAYPIRAEDVPNTNSETEYKGLTEAMTRGEFLTFPELVGVPTEKVAIIAIDTEALIALYDDALKHNDVENPPSSAVTIEQHWVALKRMIQAHEQVPWIVVLGHHPIATHGPHGGHHPRPLGLRLETIWEGVKGLVSSDIQDLSHRANKTFAERLGRELGARQRIIYVAGHEHSLQFLWYKDRLLQVISGAGSKVAPVGKNRDTIFKVKEPGIVRFDVAGNDLWVEFIHGNDPRKRKSSLFRVSH